MFRTRRSNVCWFQVSFVSCLQYDLAASSVDGIIIRHRQDRNSDTDTQIKSRIPSTYCDSLPYICCLSGIGTMNFHKAVAVTKQPKVPPQQRYKKCDLIIIPDKDQRNWLVFVSRRSLSSHPCHGLRLPLGIRKISRSFSPQRS
ncbi:hypothetical protein F4804DRAFT_20407 [Jackrogersella minutella]|nr:hypothetical protein F4804DRAFT_20407 [Jackrogersella minutella]